MSGQQRVFLLGATGTIGRSVARALVDHGFAVSALVRTRTGTTARSEAETAAMLPGVDLRFGDALDPRSLEEDGFAGDRFDVVVSCLASRTGHPGDAWRVDCEAHRRALACAREAGAGHFVLLSAICVQKPLLAFQRAKLAFEEELIASDVTHSIVRPTAYFKSLCGQIGRVGAGKPFLVFGNGRLTACKPISDRDLAHFMVRCIRDARCHDAVLPIGGPGPAITPREQGEELFRLLGREPRFKSVPPQMFGAAATVLGGLGRIVPPLSDKAEFARIARYYGTESMLVWDEDRRRYDPELTPSFGSDTLFEHYRRVVAGESEAGALGEHAVFG